MDGLSAVVRVQRNSFTSYLVSKKGLGRFFFVCVRTSMYVPWVETT